MSSLSIPQYVAAGNWSLMGDLTFMGSLDEITAAKTVHTVKDAQVMRLVTSVMGGNATYDRSCIEQALSTLIFPNP